MDAMPSFDAELVERWLRRLLDTEEPLMPVWGIRPTDEESSVFLEGMAMVLAAVDDTEPPPGVVRPAELPARMLQSYLSAVAAGIAGTRRTLAAAGDQSTELPVGLESVDYPGSLALVAGLNAGAAALSGERVSSADRPARAGGPTAAESARLAGVSAAELAVDGADLHQIAGAAAGVAGGWRVGLPDDAGERVDYRARGLVGLLLIALDHVTRAPEPPAEPASCGAGPTENVGRAFPAEITFQIGLDPDQARSLAVELGGLSEEVTVWPQGQDSWHRFHIHSDRPAEVIGQVYAYGTAFDLQITDRG